MTRRPPPAFAAFREGRLRGWVRHGRAEAALRQLLRAWAAAGELPGQPLAGGRGGARRVDAGGERFVVRECRRGGLPGRFVRRLYAGIRPRPFVEVAVTERLRSVGVPAPEPMAAAVLRFGTEAQRRAFLRAGARRQEAACRAAAEAVRALHRAGAVHPDLNLGNFLVREEPSGVRVWLLDFDRVRLCRVRPRHRPGGHGAPGLPAAGAAPLRPRA